jgi:hypothetical protein
MFGGMSVPSPTVCVRGQRSGSTVDGRAYTITRHAPIAPVPAWLADRLALPAVRPDHGHVTAVR